MRLPIQSETVLRRSFRRTASTEGGGIRPSIPPCKNCDHICDVCIDTGKACGACALCAFGVCDDQSYENPPPETFDPFDSPFFSRAITF